MKLIEKEVRLDEIMIDCYNPRFIKKTGDNQEQIIKRLLQSEKAKELLLSMLSGLNWVNNIVVVPIEELSKDEIDKYEKYCNGFQKKYKYISVEGSTRLACLHQEKLKERFDAGELIPVKLTVRDIGESDKEFLRERSRLQSISNVMVVVEWGDVPKAKKIYEYYKLEQEINPGKSERERIKEIADTLGMKTSEVKTFVYRYAFFKELSDNCYDIKEKDFKYLEGLHQNISIQNKFGLDRKSMDFEWNLYVSDDDINEDIEIKQQLLYMIPEIIEIAKDEKIKSKLLRDILRRYQDCEVEDLYQKFNDICIYSKSDDYSNDGFLTIFSMDEESVKEKELKIKTSIKNSLSLLKGFPINEDFSPIYLDKIKEIRRLADNIINSMENCIEK